MEYREDGDQRPLYASGTLSHGLSHTLTPQIGCGTSNGALHLKIEKKLGTAVVEKG